MSELSESALGSELHQIDYKPKKKIGAGDEFDYIIEEGELSSLSDSN